MGQDGERPDDDGGPEASSRSAIDKAGNGINPAPFHQTHTNDHFLGAGWVELIDGETTGLVPFRKVLGGTGIFPVRQTGWKPVPPMQQRTTGGRGRPPYLTFHVLRVGR